MANIAVFSPHPDDAVLSCFFHMSKWSQNHTITVVNIFNKTQSKFLPAYSRSVLEQLKVSSAQYQSLRNAEDLKVLKKYHFNVISLNSIDAGFRHFNDKPLYPSPNQLFSGIMHTADKLLQIELHKKIKPLTKDFDFCISPLAIGNHVDHTLTRMVIEKYVPQNKLAYYADVPYWHQVTQAFQSLLPFIFSGKKSFLLTTSKKKKAVACYTSQVPLLFPTGIPRLPELVVSKDRSIKLF